MKYNPIFTLLVATSMSVFSQGDAATQQIRSLIDNYASARENKYPELLERILTPDIDQLVSTGEWRNGRKESINGMQQSSATKPGFRTLSLAKIRFPTPDVGIVDARYVITGKDGGQRKMWSTFIVVRQHGNWKITAIRNMFPTGTY
ncbi:SgcJ/EcaC family oxidoreductase [Flavobacteriaceae bacterium F89]|uniref:SgcJ/EcaC family oxidoreductase n=1 Tax=Cerina litoralis TaxID=2874477 RepID=A0AAE3ERF8_9FLAO|nr:SgcJ/EcaC family oxidoreductase [Cerina litoralis]MCG2459563.1 SgcJ/EcaC family oxidoreductase [Cerina litoralis]